MNNQRQLNVSLFSAKNIEKNLFRLKHNLKEQKKYKKIAAVSIGLSAFFLLTSVATLLFIFPFVTTTEEIFPLYLASRYIEFGRFFQRLDAVFLFVEELP